MTTRENIIDKADQFIRDKGYNAFSFKDISNDIGIKTASIHYHFPTKSDLGVATIKEHIARCEGLKRKVAHESPLVKLQAFLEVQTQIKKENKVCIVGSLATDLNTLDNSIKVELQTFAQIVINWLTEILVEGKELKQFAYEMLPRTKAIMIITNMVAIVQLSRLTSDDDFELVKETILTELRPK
ncbi:TetR/AcrR family transcriptional regulator [Flavobacterium nitrogenifigens]|uniref:Transcriptional regulator, TetR family n=1 Tax=Flavobacterium nitrogenifigens TaxID=1617283 RepID=A0A521DZP1_9FLAO|nr:TetR/AcrR family transcriptional regulator [Flavobacterium nitrogenifigens]KAF2333954.1 TetR/AcrR family transcriptional regulator [Flavobacterium nitrogenifigens]SMO77102.1 transcriptional regulator, TetR family [Flavobacterium nitrogenifigens]